MKNKTISIKGVSILCYVILVILLISIVDTLYKIIIFTPKIAERCELETNNDLDLHICKMELISKL